MASTNLILNVSTFVSGFDKLHQYIQDQIIAFDYAVNNMLAPFNYFYLHTMGLTPLTIDFDIDAKGIQSAFKDIGTYNSFYNLCKSLIGGTIVLDIPNHNLINVNVYDATKYVGAVYTNTTQVYTTTDNSSIYVGNQPLSQTINTGTQLALIDYLQGNLSAGDILDSLNFYVTPPPLLKKGNKND